MTVRSGATPNGHVDAHPVTAPRTPVAASEAAVATAACPTEPYWQVVQTDPADFSGWTQLIAVAEKLDDIVKLRTVYDAFLAEFPLCYGYWKKYADAEARLGAALIGDDGDPSAANVVHACVGAVYERGVAAIPYSVDLWTHYCTFAIGQRHDGETVRGLFERGLAYVGMDWLAHPLWDKYLDFEANSGNGTPAHVAALYSRVLQMPLRELDKYWTGFVEYVDGKKAEVVVPEEELREIAAEVTQQPPPPLPEATGEGADEAAAAAAAAAAARAAETLGDPRLAKYRDARRALYEATAAVRAAREPFEAAIKRPYFHVKPLDDAQVANWEAYLTHEETAGDVPSVIRLYERCLIPCANYPALWLRYAKATEHQQGPDAARAILQRATRVFVKRHVEVHLALARFEERQGDVEAARDVYKHVADDVAPGLLRATVEHANMERRMGEPGRAKVVFEAAMAVERSKEGTQSKVYGVLVNQYVAFLDEALGDEDAARAVYDVACKEAAGNALVWEGAVNFERHRTGRPVDERLRRVRALVGRACGKADVDGDGSGSAEDGERASGDGEAAKGGSRAERSDGTEASAAAGSEGYAVRRQAAETAGAPGLAATDQERLSSYAVEFAGLVGDAADVAAAEDAHESWFPQTTKASESRKRARDAAAAAAADGNNVTAKTAKADPSVTAAAAAHHAAAAAAYQYSGYQYPGAAGAYQYPSGAYAGYPGYPASY